VHSCLFSLPKIFFLSTTNKCKNYFDLEFEDGILGELNPNKEDRKA